jgi:RNA polymerase sigma factor (sigma-70 family)
MQDVFVTLWEKRDQINPDLKFENYLFTICYNSARKFFRRKNIEHKVKDYLLKNSPDSISETANTVIYNELIEMVERAVEKLLPKRKLVYKLSKQELEKAAPFNPLTGKQRSPILSKLNFHKCNHLSSSTVINLFNKIILRSTCFISSVDIFNTNYH